MTIYQAQAQKDQLLAALAAPKHLELDLSASAKWTPPACNCCCCSSAKALQQGKQVTISGHSPTRPAILDFCNLVGVFGDPMVIPANA
jgi:hypothetical protein